jgi:hypothetical protein
MTQCVYVIAQGLTRLGKSEDRESGIGRPNFVHWWQRWIYQWDKLRHLNRSARNIRKHIVGSQTRTADSRSIN